jgi:phage FluMu protein Com
MTRKRSAYRDLRCRMCGRLFCRLHVRDGKILNWRAALKKAFGWELGLSRKSTPVFFGERQIASIGEPLEIEAKCPRCLRLGLSRFPQSVFPGNFE